MAITPIRVYRWDDDNAPVITNFRDWTQIKAWFQAIFVDGYLENDGVTPKSGLGWTLTFDDVNNIIDIDIVEADALKPTPKIRLYYSNVVAQTSPSVNYRRPYYEVYESELTNKFDSINSTDVHGCNFIGLNDESGTKITQWVVVGNEKAFHVFTGYNDSIDGSTGIKPIEFTTSNNYIIGWAFFGRIINDGVSLNDYNFISKYSDMYYTYNDVSATQATFYGSNGLDSYSYFKTSRNINGDFSSYTIHEENWFKWDRKQLSTYQRSSIRYPYVDGGLYLKDFFLYHDTDQTYLGKLPGVYISEQNLPLTPTSGLQEFTGDGIYADERFLCFYNGESSLFINLDRSWDV
jgi:hypothetical protein